MISIKISKRNLNRTLRMLASGFNSHKKYADFYVIAFCVTSHQELIAKVLGGEYLPEAEVTGNGSFSVNYRWIKMFVKACKAKTIEIHVDHGMMTINKSVSVQVKQSMLDINLPLVLNYSICDLARLDRRIIRDEILSFWGLHRQLTEAIDEISNIIEKTCSQLMPYFPSQMSGKKCKEILRHDILDIPLLYR